MTPTAKSICHSISSAGIELITWEIWAHRFILAEINTHRVLTRNYRSSRAVPTKTLIAEVRNNPAIPVGFRRNAPGMGNGDWMTGDALRMARLRWISDANSAAWCAEQAAEAGENKETVNRRLEPYLMVPGVISATSSLGLDNFFTLRRAPEAQPEFKALADAMWDAWVASEPKLLHPGEWHMPYVDIGDWGNSQEALKKISVARCARVSYKPFDADRPSHPHEDIALHDRLKAQGHWSPFEHIATPAKMQLHDEQRHLWGNFYGWCQYRRFFAEGRTP